MKAVSAPRVTIAAAAVVALLVITALRADAYASGEIRRVKHPSTVAEKEVRAAKNKNTRMTELPPAHNGNSTWAMMRITDDGEVTLVAVQPSHHPVSACRYLVDAHIATDSTHILVSYIHPVDGEECHLPIRDPRQMYHDHDKGNGKFGGGIHMHEAAEFAVALHPLAYEVHIVDFAREAKTVSKVRITLAAHRAFEALAVVTLDATKVSPTTVQVVGPMAEQRNIVFLSSGYKATQQATFDADVAKLVSFMQLPENTLGVSSQPYMRYFSLTNIFKIFYLTQHSLQFIWLIEEEQQ